MKLRTIAGILALLVCPSHSVECIQTYQTQKPVKVSAVDFISARPVIDGTLDPFLSRLEKRILPYTYKTDSAGTLVNVHYRLAYSAEFLYLYIEAEQENYVVRDRGYQNGDGFHMAIALPEKDNYPAGEFYILGFYPEPDQRKQRMRKFIWYRNVDLSFKYLPLTEFEVKAENGHTGFELILPWEEIYPYHPWFHDTIGFNLCYVQAVGTSDKIYHYALMDPNFQSEQKKRLYTILKFEDPILKSGSMFAVQLKENHVTKEQSLTAVAAAVSTRAVDEMFNVYIENSYGEVAASRMTTIPAPVQPAKTEITFDTALLKPDEYMFTWSAGENDRKGKIPFTILPEFSVPQQRDRLTKLKDVLSKGSQGTILYRLEEIEKMEQKYKRYDSAERLLRAMNNIINTLREAETGTDFIAGQTGHFRRAYRSLIDETLQPYSIRVPDQLDRKKKYPLIVFLHGSGETDIGQLRLRRGVDDCIEMAPNGRGTSNYYSTPLAQHDIRESVDDVILNYPVDRKNIILAGFSMGGYGVLRTAYENPGRFRALTIFSGHPNLAEKYRGGEQPNFLEPEYLEPFRGKHIFVFHGGNDRNCPAADAKKMVEMLKKAGALVEFHFNPEKGHELPGVETMQRYRQWLREQIGNNK